MAILAANADAARAHTSKYPLYLPLHIAVKQRSTENLLALLRAYPEGVKDRVKMTDVANSNPRMYSGTFTRENVTPLLLAARAPSKATPEMFAALCWAYPEALLQRDEKGNVPNGFCTQSQEHGLRRMAHNIIWDYGALVEFHLCMFSARRTAGHPLCKFGSDSFAPHHRQIESFLLPCHGESKLFSPHLSMRRRILELCLFPISFPSKNYNFIARLHSGPWSTQSCLRTKPFDPKIKQRLHKQKRRQIEYEKARRSRRRRRKWNER